MSVAGGVRLCSVPACAAFEVKAGRRVARAVLDGGSDASTHAADSRTDAANNVVRCCFDPIRPPLCSALVTKTRFLTHRLVSADRRTVLVGDMVAAIVSMSRRRGGVIGKRRGVGVGFVAGFRLDYGLGFGQIPASLVRRDWFNVHRWRNGLTMYDLRYTTRWTIGLTRQIGGRKMPRCPEASRYRAPVPNSL